MAMNDTYSGSAVHLLTDIAAMLNPPAERIVPVVPL